MGKLHRFTGIAIVALTASSAGAIAADEMTCEPFDAYGTGEFQETYQVDYNADGSATAGDKKIGFRVLLNIDGERIGQRFFIGTIKKYDAEGKELDQVTETVNVFADGAIFTTKQRVAGGDLPSRINAGTGVFAGASGTVKVDRDGPSNVYRFNVTCSGPAQS